MKVVACKAKKWLPNNYGSKPFSDLESSDQDIVSSFEDKKTYDVNINKSLFKLGSDLKLLEC